jgi:hypothetical protein
MLRCLLLPNPVTSLKVILVSHLITEMICFYGGAHYRIRTLCRAPRTHDKGRTTHFCPAKTFVVRHRERQCMT